MTCIISWMRLNFNQIGPLTVESAALGRLRYNGSHEWSLPFELLVCITYYFSYMYECAPQHVKMFREKEGRDMLAFSEMDPEFNQAIFSCQQTIVEIRQCHAGGSTFASIFQKSWLICVYAFAHIFSQVNATNVRIRFYRTTK